MSEEETGQPDQKVQEELSPQEQAKQMLKDIYDDGFAEINGREYHFSTMNHGQRRKVFSYYSTVNHDMNRQNYAFLDTPKFQEIEKIIFSKVLFNGIQLSKIGEAGNPERPLHFETYPQDYLTFLSAAMGAISSPFFSVNRTS